MNNNEGFKMYKKFIISLLLLPILTPQFLYTDVFYDWDFQRADTAPHTSNKTTKQQITEKETLERFHYINSKINFRECMTKNLSNVTKNKNGVPSECEKLACIFITCGGNDEIVKMVEGLKKFQN